MERAKLFPRETYNQVIERPLQREREKIIRELEKLTKKQAKRIIDKVESIASNLFRFVKKLGGIDLYRLRVVTIEL